MKSVPSVDVRLSLPDLAMLEVCLAHAEGRLTGQAFRQLSVKVSDAKERAQRLRSFRDRPDPTGEMFEEQRESNTEEPDEQQDSNGSASD